MTKSKTGFWIDLIFVSVFFVFSAFEPPLWAHESSFCINLLFPENLEKPDDRSHWRLQYYKGTPAVQFEGTGEKKVLRLRGCGSIAFGLKRKVDIDTAVFPLMEWHWKADQIPAGGDIRRADCDDQALQLYVIFPSLGFPDLLKSPTIAYIWDTEAPKDFFGPSPQARLPMSDTLFCATSKMP